VIFEPADGGLRLTIDAHSRKVVTHLLGELREEIVRARESAPRDVAEHLRRLFPTAYHDDAKLNDEYRRLTHHDLADAHLSAIDEAVRLLSPDCIFGEGDIDKFVRAINAMRLVIGTLLDVTEDDDTDESDDESRDGSSADVSPHREVYDYLGWLLHSSLDQLRA